jgi:hypothetical protein
MKAFKMRIRQETRKTLHEELTVISSTSQKRKLRLKERKTKKTNKGKGVKKEVYKYKSRDFDFISIGRILKVFTITKDSMEFFAAEDGRIRASDKGGPASFRKSDNSVSDVSTGYMTHSVDRPPDLRGRSSCSFVFIPPNEWK